MKVKLNTEKLNIKLLMSKKEYETLHKFIGGSSINDRLQMGLTTEQADTIEKLYYDFIEINEESGG